MFRRLVLFIATVAVVAMVSAAPRAAGPDRRAPVLRAMADVLQARYVDASRADALASMLREAARDGRFSGVDDPDAFVAATNAAMRSLVPDLHLGLSYEPDREYSGADGSASTRVQRADDRGVVRQVLRTGRMDGRSNEQIARTNYGVARVEHMAGNIGYLKLTRFVPTDLSRDTLAAAVTLLAHSDAVVVDLRGNIGGAPDTVGELLSAFFPADGGPVELHAAENRALGIRSAIATDPALSRPGLARAPLYVLTDARTASAAEMFADAARRTRNATLVGQTTSGAGNGATRHSVGNGFALTLSEWCNLTGAGWEGTGVRPDVEVPAEGALERALELARARLEQERGQVHF